MSILTQQGRNVMADHIKPMLQLPNPNNHGLQEGLLFRQSPVDRLIILAVLEPPQRRGPVARGFVEMPRIPPKRQQGSSKL